MNALNAGVQLSAVNSSNQPKLSVIIPALNEEQTLSKLLADISAIRKNMGAQLECLVVDGGSTDRTVETCRRFNVDVVHAPCGRGRQLAAGANVAVGEVLLFVHADSRLKLQHCKVAVAKSRCENLVAGGFHLHFDSNHFILKIGERINRLRFRLTHVFYGDHGLFIKKSVYEQAGGFAAIPLFEDVEFSRRLRKMGDVRLFEPPILTSARRFMAGGVARTYLKMALMHLFFWVGVSPNRLALWYRKDEPSEAVENKKLEKS